jgi:hypothetical protein
MEKEKLKEIEKVIKEIRKVEGSERLRETIYIIAPKNKIKLYFTAHRTASRYLFFCAPAYEEVSMLFLNPRFVDELMTSKFMLDIINYNNSMRGRRQ